MVWYLFKCGRKTETKAPTKLLTGSWHQQHRLGNICRGKLLVSILRRMTIRRRNADTVLSTSRFILRILPIEVSCYASKEEISKAIQPLVEQYFPVETQNPQKVILCISFAPHVLDYFFFYCTIFTQWDSLACKAWEQSWKVALLL